MHTFDGQQTPLTQEQTLKSFFIGKTNKVRD